MGSIEPDEYEDPEYRKQSPQDADLEQQAQPHFAFDHASIRAAFVRKVFAIVTTMILVVVVMTVASGFMLAVLCSRVPPQTVLLALSTTTLSCVAIIGFASQTKYDITSHMFVVFAGTVAVFIFGLILAIMSFFIYIKALHVIFSAVVCVLFMVWLAIDTQMIVGGKRYEISPEDYIFAALMLFIDIYQIFITMLSLFNAAND
ncbi:hypothetical protein NECAME_14038 [Necator americanus]|uniref:Inhibitor of apoptosis-promoting Bax1 n=1 Tax=Necator americanus TaxID=51031 RepID=W2SQQ8_NECAM|nr:hypothetical protein NECAME_14038 [Necator americanus]ETN71965.1 hypothetical protein NECAME_14038 [Necator americanus]